MADNWQVLDTDADGAVVYFDYDDATDTIKTKRVVDVEPIMEEAKADCNEGLVNRKSEFRRIMSIPPSTAMIWGQAQGFGADWYQRIFGKGNEEVLMRLVHDRDLGYFRTLPGDYRGNFKRR